MPSKAKKADRQARTNIGDPWALSNSAFFETAPRRFPPYRLLPLLGQLIHTPRIPRLGALPTTSGRAHLASPRTRHSAWRQGSMRQRSTKCLNLALHLPVSVSFCYKPQSDCAMEASVSTATEQNKIAIQRFLDAWNNRQPEAFDELVAYDVVRHCQATPAMEVRNLDQLKAFLQHDTASFPDSKQTIVHMVAENDLVGAWVTYEGTQQGPIGPLPASGARTNFDFGAMFRMVDGKIAEWWVTWDNMTILRQLGHLPSV